jgi:Shikimate kinase
MMGSGKTTVGKILAREIKYNFIDTDQLIEDQENKTCKQILTENGETFFRYLELNLLSSIDYENTVIATGGGLPIFNNNIEILLKKSLVIYIKTSIEDLAKRLKNDNKRAISKEISFFKENF